LSATSTSGFPAREHIPSTTNQNSFLCRNGCQPNSLSERASRFPGLELTSRYSGCIRGNWGCPLGNLARPASTGTWCLRRSVKCVIGQMHQDRCKQNFCSVGVECA
jgi:hypothetical protein